MNQNAPIEERPAARARPTAAAAPTGPSGLNPESRALLRVLTEGDLALARRKDLGELLRRIQATLPAADAPAEADRLDRLEGSLNRIDGALRIELAPILKAAVVEGLATGQTRAPRRSRGMVLLFLAGLALGTFGGPAIKDASLRAWQIAAPVVSGVLPPNRGSFNFKNQLE